MFGNEHGGAKGTNEWLTPFGIVDALGPFDLDPCSLRVRPWPTATRHIAPPEDSLADVWAGRVWLNPPYGRHVGKWMKRMAEHDDGIALTFARTDSQWFQRYVLRAARSVLFLAGRIYFCRPDGTSPGRSGAPSCIIAYGDRAADRLRGAIPALASCAAYRDKRGKWHGVTGTYVRLAP